MSLYRKYRPQTFSSLMGQDHVSQTIANALKLGRVSHAYLFTGPRGTGKTSTARLLAKSINCLNVKDAEPCNECEICRDIADGRLIDIIEIDAASNRGIDEMRDLREKINFSPTRARSKVYIIDEVHMLTKEAFNALLKTLEEPPTHVYFILATTEVHKIPETILSRCQRFDFKRITEKVLIDRLNYIAAEEKIVTDEKALSLIAHHAEGGLRDAISLFEQLTIGSNLTYDHVCSVLGISGFASIEKLYDFLQKKDVKSGLDEIHGLYMDGFDLNYFNKRFLEYLRREMIQSVEDGNDTVTATLMTWIQNFQDAYEQYRFSTIAQLPLEMAVIKSCSNIAMLVQNGSLPTQNEVAPPAVARAKEPVSPFPSDPVMERVHQHLTDKSSPKGVPPISEQPAPEKSDAVIVNQSTAAPSAELTMEALKAQWGRIFEHIKNPTVKRLFQQASLFKVDGHDVTLAFPSNFHLEKMMEAACRVEVERAFEEVFSLPVKITGEIHKVSSEVSAAEKEAEDNLKDLFEV